MPIISSDGDVHTAHDSSCGPASDALRSQRQVKSRHGSRATIGLTILAGLATCLTACASPDAADVTHSGNKHTSSTSSTTPGGTTPSATTSTTPTATPTPSASSAPTPTTKYAGYPGAGKAVTKPTCAAPPAAGAPLKASGAVAPNLPALIPGTNHGKAAEGHVYAAKTVHDWMLKPQTQPKNKKIAFLTFDDGPSQRTPQVLKGLKSSGGRATFFTISSHMGEVDKSLLNQMLEQGNALAIHSYSHDYDYLYPGREASKSHIGCDIDYAMAQMRSFVGSGFTTGAVRNPGGHMSWRGWSTADPAMSERHMSWIDWNALSKDAEGKPLTSTDEAVQNLKETAAEYGTPNVLLILNHDAADKKVTAKSVPAMVKYLKSQGYELGVIA